MNKYRTDEETFKHLKSRMRPGEADEFESYKHLKIESGFYDRVFVVYQPKGIKPGTVEQLQPKVLSVVRVTGLVADLRSGASARLYDETSGTEMTIGYVPRKLFNYPIFISMPTNMHLKMGTQLQGDGVRDSFTFALLVKCKNKSDFYTPESVYMETPANLKKLFPSILNEPFKF